MLANEEVTSDGRSERGNFPVFRKRLRQWMMRITAYSDRLLDDLDVLDWPDKVKAMQRNWIGRSTGAAVLFDADGGDVEVFTTRPDTLFGATYLVLAPEHDLVDGLTAAAVARRRRPAVDRRCAPPRPRRWPPTDARSRRSPTWSARRTRPRPVCSSARYATNPANGQQVPVFIADYVLVGYGTGAIMAVPGHDQRDWEFADGVRPADRRSDLPAAMFTEAAYTGDGALVNSGYLDGLSVDGGQGGDHRAAGGRRPRPCPRRIQAAGLAVRPPAVLG